ncbi:MAG: pilus assembly protein PilP [Deltaproteobacteria bacterium]|nr:pilus assembly protein PilP [Deltaproteobacteria bacterium]
MSRTLLLLSALALAAACGGPSKPPPRAPEAPKTAPAAAAAASDKPVAPEWTYTSVGKRDPFRSFLAEIEVTGQGGPNRCPTALGRFEIEQLRLVAVITGLDDPVAMVQAPTGVGYSIRRGACIGKNGGTVAAVRSGEVVVSEWAVRADGSRDRTQTIMKLPKQASITQE